MRAEINKSGSAMLVAVFAIALITTLVSGLLLLTTEQIQLMQNQVNAAQAINIAEAGINDAFSQIRTNPNWNAGYTAKAFAGGNYTVDVNNVALPSIIVSSTATSSQGYSARLVASCEITLQNPTPIRIDQLTINQ